MLDKPDYKRDLRAYVERREPLSPFLMAVLSNDLRQAVACATPEEFRYLRQIVHFVQWRLPGVCQGSPVAIEAWLNGAYPHVRGLVQGETG